MGNLPDMISHHVFGFHCCCNALIKIAFEIAYLKEALRTWKGVKSPEAVFFAACKERRKPESAQVKYYVTVKLNP